MVYRDGIIIMDFVSIKHAGCQTNQNKRQFHFRFSFIASKDAEFNLTGSNNLLLITNNTYF